MANLYRFLFLIIRLENFGTGMTMHGCKLSTNLDLLIDSHTAKITSASVRRLGSQHEFNINSVSETEIISEHTIVFKSNLKCLERSGPAKKVGDASQDVLLE